MIRTVLIDDHRLITQGLRALLESTGSFQVVADFTLGKAFLDRYDELSPQAIVVDIRLPDIDGLELVSRVRLKDKAVKILVLSMHDEPVFRAESRRAGADAFVSKSEDLTNVMRVLLNVIEGRQSGGPDIVIKPSLPGSHLSTQEQAILRKIAEGHTSSDIGSFLGISPLTVKTHRRNLFRKLGAENSAELVRIAYERGHL